MLSTTAKDDWDTHWSAYDASNQLNPAQAYRRRLLVQLLALTDAPEARVVDIGSGTGEFVAHLHRQFPNPAKLGIEYSAKGVDIARARGLPAAFHQIDLLVDVTTLSSFRNWGTHAVCSEVLEHVDDPVTLMRNAATFLTPGCRVVVTVPGGPMSAFDRYIGHRQHFTTVSLRDVLERAGYDVEFVTGAGFPFFNLYRLLVLARGETLIADAEGEPGPLLKAASSVFNGLMRGNLLRSPWGWQMVAVARKPA